MLALGNGMAELDSGVARIDTEPVASSASEQAGHEDAHSPPIVIEPIAPIPHAGDDDADDSVIAPAMRDEPTEGDEDCTGDCPGTFSSQLAGPARPAGEIRPAG